MTRPAPELERLQAARPQAAGDTRTLVDDQAREALLAAITADPHDEYRGADADHRRRWLGRRAATHRGARPGVVAGSALGLAGIGTALALVLGATTTSPAFAVTRNHDGTVTIYIARSSGIAGANARLHQLGIRAHVVQQVPAGFRCTSTVGEPQRGAPASERSVARVQWTIDLRKLPRDRTLALTPPSGPPPGWTNVNSGNSGNSGKSGNSGNSRNSGNSGSGRRGSHGQVWWYCGTEGPVAGSGPPPQPPGSGGNSGNS
jgi:hypothetical protein